MSQSQVPNVQSLFQSALDEGTLSRQSFQTLNVADLGAQIQAALGTPALDVESAEVVLVTVMPDDSGSISEIREDPHNYLSKRVGPDLMRQGHNLVVDSLVASKQKDAILMHTRYLNGRILFPYSPITQAVRMDTGNYNPNLGTPLYDQVVMLLGTVLAKSQEFSLNGVPVRTITLVITDGRDLHSVKQTAKSVASIVRDMLATEQHIIAAMGIDDGDAVNFRQVFTEMGIHDEWILTPANTPSEIRKAFQVFSQSAVRASQGAASFSKTAMGGFGQ